jgi:hypothetical protein
MASPITSLAISCCASSSDGFCFEAPLIHPCSRTAAIRTSSAGAAIRGRGTSAGGSISSAIVRSAAAADCELVISLISFTPPQTHAAASTHRLLPAESCAEIMASSARAACSTSPPVSASSLKFDMSSFRSDLSAVDFRQPRCDRCDPQAAPIRPTRHRGVMQGRLTRRLHGPPVGHAGVGIHGGRLVAPTPFESRHAWNTAAASSSSCAKRRRIFKPDSLASITSLAPVAWTVREVASRCSASKRNVILHDGISPFGVAIAPAYCTDAIFILTDGGFAADATGGGASFATCCGTVKTRSPSICFVIYRGCPVFPCNCLTGSTS